MCAAVALWWPLGVNGKPLQAAPGRGSDLGTWLAQGEQALAEGDADRALAAFERAASLRHSAEAEQGLVRALMQTGDYRRTLGFAAHVAGAHKASVDGTLRYAWLLHLGGQAAFAAKVLAQAQARLHNEPRLAEAQTALRSGGAWSASATINLPDTPAAATPPLPAVAQVLGSAVLVDHGQRALAPLSLLPGMSGESGLWLRDGLGRRVGAVVETRHEELGVAVLKLRQGLAEDAAFAMAPRDPFPGSPGFVVAHRTAPDTRPGWPVLSVGFLGSARPDGLRRGLGIEQPAGSQGGAVLDSVGRLAGLVLPAADGPPAWVSLSVLRRELGHLLAADDTAGEPPSPRAPADLVYERSLRNTLQLIGLPASAQPRASMP